MDIDRLLSSLWFKMYGFTGKAKHWRNEQNLGLRQVSQKTEQDNEKVKHLLLSNEPFFIGRYGTIELHNFLKGFRLLIGDKNPIKTMKSILFSQPECWSMGGGNTGLQTNAGVFPHTDECLMEFTKIYLEASKKIDVLASWQTAEEWLYKYKILQTSNKIDYNILEYAYRIKNPWTSALKGKKVLIISPFAEEMVRQYKSKNRHLLFSNQEFLPDFEISAIKSVNTAGGNSESCGYNSWSGALSFMKAQIRKEDFDIALLGCGAYAFPLGAFIKDLGKQAITVCGALQTYFGIYGGRTEHLPERNQYWIRPEVSTRPLGFEAIENSAYW